MRVAAIAATVVAGGVGSYALHRALDDDWHHRLRRVDDGQYQHAMIATAGVGVGGVLAAGVLGLAHLKGWNVTADVAAGVAAGLGLSVLGSVLLARVQRAPDGDVAKEWAS